MATYFKLNSGCSFYPYEGSSDAEEFLIRTPKGRQFRLSSLAKEILEGLDGSTSLETIAERLHSRNISISAGQLQSFLEQEYGPLEIFEGHAPVSAPVSAPVQEARKSLVPIFLHWRLLSGRLTYRISKLFSWLFNRFVAMAGVLAIVGCHYWLYASQLPALVDDEVEVNLMLVSLVALISVLFHEFGHSSAVTRYGGTPGGIGFGLYAFMPSFYADVSEIWRFPRRQRMVVDWAGVYFQQLVFCIFTVLSYTTGVAEFAVAGTLVDTMTLLNLNPLFQFDGYWFLVDYLGLPELHRLAWTQIRRWFLRSKEALVMPAMRRHGRRIFLVYAIGSVGCIALLLRLEYRYVLHPSATFFARLPKTLHALVTALKTGEFMKAGSHLLGILYAVIIPLSLVLGLSMYATRIYRYFTRRSTTIVRSSA